MDYLCYISRTKVDSLFSQLDSEQYSDALQHISSEQTRAVSLGSKLGKAIGVVQGDLTFGRKDTIQLERKVKTAYVAKLRSVLLAIAADHGEIPDIEDLLLGRAVGDQIHYDGEGKFGVAHTKIVLAESDVVELTAKENGSTLHLSCSFRFFSEGHEGGYLIHSGNNLFFQGIIKVQLGGVFILLDRQGNDIYGTPLYLKLSPDHPQSHLAL